MSVIGRLWRRAPAWRLCGLVALACTGMAAMFPPALPRRTAVPSQAAAGPAPSPPGDAKGPGTTARYVPQPDPASLPYSTLVRPPLSPGRTGIVPQAGRLMPLPAGAWQTLAFSREAGATATQASIMDRTEGGLLTGLLIVASPGPVGSSAGPATAPTPCVAPDILSRRVAPPTPGNAYAHECWTIAVAVLPVADRDGRRTGLLGAGLDRLAALHVTVPDRMLAVRFVQSDETGWMFATLFLPDRRDTAPGTLQHLEAWTPRFATLFRRGYEGTLAPGDVTPAIARDPQG